jgi:dodecin
MVDNVYKTIEITGTSRKSMEDAVRVALEKAALTVHNLRWFKVTETRGKIEGNTVDHWQVTMQIGFTLD